MRIKWVGERGHSYEEETGFDGFDFEIDKAIIRSYHLAWINA